MEDGESVGELVVADRQRRRQPEHALAGRADEQVAVEAGADDLAGRPVEVEREQKAAATRLWEGRADERLLRLDSRQQLVVDRVDDGTGCGTGDRVAAEGARVVAGDEPTRA